MISMCLKKEAQRQVNKAFGFVMALHPFSAWYLIVGD
jgi:hypothetical protein